MGKVLTTLALTAFLDSVGFGIIIPVLPYYTLKLGATPFQFSLLTVAYSVAQLLFSPYVSGLSDVRGRKNILRLGIGSEVLGYLIIGLSPSFYPLLLARFLTGALTSNLPILLSYVTEMDQEERSRNIGMLSGFYGVGFVAGPVLGGVFSPLGYRNTFLIVAGLALLNFLLVSVNIREDVEKVKVSRPSLLETLRGAGPQFALILALSLSFAILQGTLAFYGDRFYRWGPEQIGVSLGVVGVVQAIAQFTLVYRIVKKVGEKASALLGLSLSLISYLLLSFPTGQVEAYGSLVLLALGYGVAQNSVLTLLSKTVPKGGLGGAFGFAQSSTALGSLIGFPVGDSMFQYVSPTSEYLLSSFVVLGSIAYLAFGIREFKTS
ncbi:MFS transporter [Metallosphaera tengchongensis]|uniref:MFS transporter n=1 Tax=Metallosphaera tengchongensis TaxID=1532350 RepID=A0A6N0NYM6_9CREN|nr:MFS transporter [Metallosphaera tengchongensis]QKR00669.1 MFS transporter [Metallosphaera tengchongensis]